jgi:hypothetical protein
MIESDSSDYISANVLLQCDKNEVLCLITFFSKRLILAEYNYKIYNKELLAII